ncbi:MAG: metallophosphoesterase family protein [Planctomycetota bacterium]
MWIGVIADTEGELHPRALEVFEGMDFILHCGGIGDPSILLELSNVAPTSGVVGAGDTAAEYEPLKSILFQKFSDVPIFVTHDIGSPRKPYQTVLDVLKDMEPKALLFGKTRQPFSAAIEKRLWFNPGSASGGNGEYPATVGILEIDGQAVRGEIIEL